MFLPRRHLGAEKKNKNTRLKRYSYIKDTFDTFHKAYNTRNTGAQYRRERTQDDVQELVNKLPGEVHAQGAEIDANTVGVRAGRNGGLQSSNFGLHALFGGNAREDLASHNSD